MRHASDEKGMEDAQAGLFWRDRLQQKRPQVCELLRAGRVRQSWVHVKLDVPHPCSSSDKPDMSGVQRRLSVLAIHDTCLHGMLRC